MITTFRNHLKAFSLVIWVGIFAFVAGGSALYVFGPFSRGSNNAITVGNVKISRQQYQTMYNNYYKTYSKLLGNSFSKGMVEKLGLKNLVKNRLINQAILQIEAKKDGIKISDASVALEIESNPNFSRSGKFSEYAYNAFLNSNNITKKKYENSVRNNLLMRQEAQRLIGNVNIPDNLVKEKYLSSYEKRSYRYLTINSSKYEDRVRVSQNNLENFYAKNKEKFKIPQKVVIKYINIDIKSTQKFIKIKKVNEKKFYDSHPDLFMSPAVVHARHILIADKNGNYSAALKKAEAIYKKLKKGASFKKLAEKYSDDPGSKNRGGDLGYIAKNQLVKPFANAAFSLKIGQISKPVKTRFGYHIIEVLDRKSESVEPFKKVESAIGSSLRKTNAYQNLFNNAKRAQMAWKSGDTHIRYPIITSIPFAYNGTLFGDNTKNVYQSAVLIAKNEVSSPIKIGSDRYILFKKIKIIKSYVPKFADIKSMIRKDVVRVKSEEYAKKLGQRVLKTVRNIGMIKTEKKYRLKFVTTKPLLIADLSDTLPSCSPQTLNKLKKSKAKICGKDGLYTIVELKEISKFDKKDFQSKKVSIYNRLRQVKMANILNSKIKQLRKKVKITTNEKFINSI